MAITIHELERRLTHVERSFQRIQKQLDRSDKLFENFRAYTNSCFERVFERLDEHDQRFDRIDSKLEAVNQRFGTMDTQFVGIDTKFIGINARLTNIEQNMVTQLDLAAMESRLKDIILNTFQKPSA